jgi:hypothetical protein
MKWLITVSGSVDAASLDAALSRHGARQIAATPPVPMGAGEYVIEADGPPDLPVRMGQEPGIHGVYPSSEQTLY